MKKYRYIFTVAFFAALILSCDDTIDDKLPGIKDAIVPKDVFKREYTLTADDYTAIANNSANKQLALAGGLADELKALGTNKYFTDVLTAEEYAPAFISTKYTPDDGASVKLTYQVLKGKDEQVEKLRTATIYTLAAADYDAAWGAGAGWNFFAPSKGAAAYLPGILAATQTGALNGDIRCVNYNVSGAEPVAGANVYDKVNVLYAFDGTVWKAYSGTVDAVMLSLADFKEMGLKYDNFSSGTNADEYLPVYLSKKYSTMLKDLIAVYKYYESPNTSIRADKYLYANGALIKESKTDSVTAQFVYSKGSWKFDPSTVIDLPSVKGSLISTPFFQAITDWVKLNHPEYVTSYGNNDYYYGGSAYQNNFDFKPDSWRNHLMSAYGSMTNDELIALMFSRLPESFPHALTKLYPDAAPVDGVDVIYTINFVIYTGVDRPNYTIRYKVVGNGRFEYVEDSLKAVAES